MRLSVEQQTATTGFNEVNGTLIDCSLLSAEFECSNRLFRQKTHIQKSYKGLHWLQKLLEQPLTCMFSMNKSEALMVLSEIRDAQKKSEVLNCVSLDGSQVSHISTGGYEIRMKCELDSVSRDVISGIMKRNELYMKEQNGYVILRSLRD